MAVDINHHIPHIFQGDNNYCWATALAMVMGRHSIDGAFHVVDLVTAAGVPPPGSHANLDGRYVRQVIRAVHLRQFPSPSPVTAESLASHLRSGPCALFVKLAGVPPPNLHVLVLSGIRGDGSESTMLTIHDPNQAGVTLITLATFLNLTISSIAYIAHR